MAEASLRIEDPDSDGVAVIWFDRVGKPVNTLSVSLTPEFEALLDRVEKDPAIKAVVIASAKKNSFVAGADIDDLNEVTTAAEGAKLSRGGQKLMDRMEALKKPGVAAINGEALGGGLELALACDARVAADHKKTTLALPEVMLGLLPGAGGTKRLPKLVGLPAALDMMLTGKTIKASRALKMGLVDEVVPPHMLLERAKAMAKRLASGKKSPHRKQKMGEQIQGLLLETTPMGRQVIFGKAREQVMKQTGGLFPAPLKILEVVEEGTAEAEANGFGELLMTTESAALRHVFACITALKKDDGPGTDRVLMPGKSKPKGDRKKYTQAPAVNHVGMLGGGLMGAGIASVLADRGITVRIKDIRPEALQGAWKYADRIFSKAAKRKKYSRQDADMRRNRISGGLDWAGMGTAEVIIEAVPEKLELKQAQVAEIEARTKKDAIFATNTSALPITEIASKAAHPDRVIGMHFFSPVEKMPLVEVVVTKQTAPWVTKTIAQLGRTMGKHVIVVNDGPGFYTTRVLAPYMTEAMHMLLAGYDPLDVDEAATRVGFQVGPVTLLDEVGIDVGSKVTETMKAYFAGRMEFPDDSITKKFLAEGRLGRKASKGFYVYENGDTKKVGGKKVVDNAVRAHLPTAGGPKVADFATMSDRLLLALVNEAAYCLHEGILNDSKSGDLGAIFGIGFPPGLGGPLFYADARGIKSIVARLNELAEKFGPRFKPCPLLEQMATEGRTFHGAE